MSGSDILFIVLLAITILLSAFFSSSEMAFIALQRIRLKHMMNTKVKGADLVAKLLERPERLLSTILLGNNLVNTAAAAIATALAIKYWPEQGILIATIAVTVLLLIFGEVTPKALATRHAERLSLIYASPIRGLSWLFTPFVTVLSSIVGGFTKMLGGTPPRSLASEEEIRTMISVGHKEGTVEKEEAEMLHKVFDFGDRSVREVMVPRPEVVAIEQGSTIGDFLALYSEHPLSRFPVYHENMDNVVGILSVKDALMALAKGNVDRQSPLDDLIRPSYFTPETKRIGELFTEMRKRNFRMAVAVDEYGGTAGIVSLSRLVEEIVGEVGDELGGVEKDYEVINEYTFQVDGGMRIDEANEKMGLELPEGDYETVAGFVLNLLRHIPRQGEQLRYKGLKIVITRMRGVKIEEILLTKEAEQGEKRAAAAG